MGMKREMKRKERKKNMRPQNANSCKPIVNDEAMAKSALVNGNGNGNNKSKRAIVTSWIEMARNEKMKNAESINRASLADIFCYSDIIVSAITLLPFVVHALCMGCAGFVCI